MCSLDGAVRYIGGRNGGCPVLARRVKTHVALACAAAERWLTRCSGRRPELVVQAMGRAAPEPQTTLRG